MEIIRIGTITNSYILPVKSGYLLIDTGYENGFTAFCKALDSRRISLKEIKYIFLTHAHDDHAGFLNELLCNTDAKVVMHEKAVEGLRRGQNSFEGGYSGRLANFFASVLALAGKAEHRFPPVETAYEHRFILFGENTKTGLEDELSCKVFYTPGHTACSISIYLDDGILFCGDAAMNGFPSLKRTTIWMEDMEAFCASWEKIIGLDPKMIYPGHGRPFPASDLKKFLPVVRKLALIPPSQNMLKLSD